MTLGTSFGINLWDFILMNIKSVDISLRYFWFEKACYAVITINKQGIEWIFDKLLEVDLE